ncbi:hypothetical protein HMPREF9145_0909 [Segatella salivae F0493]|uniref:Uncharacterized protein n=1 Tax=Segatella salivae F0493 TaxID=1395125 RepID=U2KMB9_9BACT|nr:hypothetical protein HMPREF9145_0909 [Segatella salivae F0493]
MWCDAYFDTEELVPATAVMVADHFHFFINRLCLPAAKIVKSKPITEFAFPKYIVQSCASMRYCFAFTYHLSSYLRPYIFHRSHENEGRRIS